MRNRTRTSMNTIGQTFIGFIAVARRRAFPSK
jgi:hypothetical protein